jgi:hypothetical protein
VPDNTVDRKIRGQALKYTLMDGELYRRTMDGLLLKCLNEDRARIAIGEVHDGMCGTHQSAQKMKWAIQRAGLYCPSMVDDCIRYKKGCRACQRFGDVQTVLASMLHPVVKVCPFRGWRLDFIIEVHPTSAKRHRFVLVVTDYFTKWTEAIPLKNITHREVISFVQEHIIHRFRMPQTLTMEQGASFMSHQFKEFAASMKIKVLNSSPYYAQDNVQAKSSNKTMLKIIKKKIDDHLRKWHEGAIRGIVGTQDVQT